MMLKSRLKRFVKRLREVISIPVMTVLPGQLAFYFVLSLIPLITLVGLIGSLFSLSIENFIHFIKTSFPASTSNLIVPLIEGKGFDINVFLFIISAFLLASNGTHSVIVTSNILYGVEDNNYIKRRIKAILLAVMIVILLGFIIIIPAFGNLILSSLKNFELITPIYDELLAFFKLIELPLSFIFIYFNIKLIYTIAPKKRIKSKDSTYGAMFTTICWIIITKCYSYYVAIFSSYNFFYGSIANLITLLLWIYLLSYVFVIGLAFNAIAEQRKNDKNQQFS